MTPDSNGDGDYTFAEPGTFDPTITITASDGNTAAVQSEADVADPPTTVTPVAITATQNQPFTGTVATFINGNPQATAAEFTATLDWGDGNVSDGTITRNPDGSFTVVGTTPT